MQVHVLQITRSGRIVPDKEYKHKLIHRAHQRHVRECLAQAIFHKVLDMEVRSLYSPQVLYQMLYYSWPLCSVKK